MNSGRSPMSTLSSFSQLSGDAGCGTDEAVVVGLGDRTGEVVVHEL